MSATGFGRLLGDLNDVGQRYVIVGGIAVIRHGVVRATRDLDVVIPTDSETAVRIADVMGRWEATRPDGSPEPRRVPSAGWPLHLRTVHGPIDLLAEDVSAGGLNGLLARSDVRRVDGVEAPICSLADLVAMKRAAGRATDLEDLARLETAHGELPGPPPA